MILVFMFGRWHGAESAYARSAMPCAVRRTYSTAFGQQDTTAHRIFIFPLHAFSHFSSFISLSQLKTGVKPKEYSIGLSLRYKKAPSYLYFNKTMLDVRIFFLRETQTALKLS